MFARLREWAGRQFKPDRQRISTDASVTSAPEPAPQRLPEFFIVGAAKSGTTSLWQYLRQHPAIFMPADITWKEPSFYCDSYGVSDLAFYLSLFKEAKPDQIIGEASTPYLSSPESPGRIHGAAPESKIIIMLRNPVDRAYSLYKWMHHEKYEKADSFEEALEIEVKSRKDDEAFLKDNGHFYWDFLYFHSGLYFEQVRRYYDLFSASQIKVIIFEDFARRGLEITKEVYAFLGVDSDFTPEIKIHNEGAPGYPALSAELRRSLESRYLPDVEQLAEFLKIDLKSAWFSSHAN